MAHLGLRSISDTDFAIVDVETTGLLPGSHPIVEIGIAHYRLGHQPAVVLDTLVNPGCRAGAEEIHGISSQQLADAPTFADIAGDILEALDGRVVAGHNVGFDERFLRAEFAVVGVDLRVPTVCTMRLLPSLDLAPPMSLDELRPRFQLPVAPFHRAADDAVAAGLVLDRALRTAATRGSLAMQDLGCPASVRVGPAPMRAMNYPFAPSRISRPRPAATHQDNQATYARALIAVLADGVVTEDEARRLLALREETGLPEETWRAVHAQYFACTVTQTFTDQWVDDDEVAHIARVRKCLERLGWCP